MTDSSLRWSKELEGVSSDGVQGKFFLPILKNGFEFQLVFLGFFFFQFSLLLFSGACVCLLRFGSYCLLGWFSGGVVGVVGIVGYGEAVDGGCSRG